MEMTEEINNKALDELNAVQQAAVFLMSVGEEEAAEIVKHLDPKEVQSIGEAMAAASNVDKDRVSAILQKFNTRINEQTALGIGNEDYLRNVLNKALGKDMASDVIERILPGRQSKGLEALKWMAPASIAEIIRLEHPQIIAIVLSYLESEQAGQVISKLPVNTCSDIIMRIANLEAIQPAALFELDEILEKQVADNENSIRSARVGGIQTAADILNFVDVTSETVIIRDIKSRNEELGQEIEDSMFDFNHLTEVADRSIQALLRGVSSETLLIALRGADEAVKDKIFKNMSKRAAVMLRDDLQASEPVKLSEVESAQREILSVSRQMTELNDITAGSGDDEYI